MEIGADDVERTSLVIPSRLLSRGVLPRILTSEASVCPSPTYGTDDSRNRLTYVLLVASSYRKTLSKDTAHPAPALDALAAYVRLTDKLGFEPRNIIVMGDSAGGNLSL